MVEIFFGEPGFVRVGAIESASGTAQLYQNGTFIGTVPWSASSSNGGTYIVTVPAGTFTTTRWDSSLTIGGLRDSGSSYVAGGTLSVRVSSVTVDSQGTTYTQQLELIDGPVPTAQQLKTQHMDGPPAPIPVLLLDARKAMGEKR